MLDEARHWAETQFGTADLGDARRTHRLVSIMAAIARAPDESLPRQLGSLANTKAGDRLFACGAGTPPGGHAPAGPVSHPGGGGRGVVVGGGPPRGPSWPRMSPSAAPRRRGIRSSSWSTTT